AISGMDGADLLKEAAERHPHTMRLVVSANANRESALRCIGPTHQFLVKPYDPNALRYRINVALGLRDLLEDPALRKLLSQVQTIPSLPSAYKDIMQELQSKFPSLNRIGQIISKDIGMTAKVLQLVNSAFFGLATRISNPDQAVKLVGLDTISSLVL